MGLFYFSLPLDINYSIHYHVLTCTVVKVAVIHAWIYMTPVMRR